MRTTNREPWRGGQICGYQLEYGTGREVYCGDYKKTGSPLCDTHDEKLCEENGGTLPRFAPGNALGIRLTDVPHLEPDSVFDLSWEPIDEPGDPHGEHPIPATDEEVRAWQESGP